jgi:hypothetical protein
LSANPRHGAAILRRAERKPRPDRGEPGSDEEKERKPGADVTHRENLGKDYESDGRNNETAGDGEACPHQRSIGTSHGNL